MHNDSCGCEKYLKEGLAFLQDEKWEDAKKTYEKALKIHEDNSVAWGNLGFAYDRLGNEEKSVACYNKALEYNPANKHVLVNKGAYLAKKKKLVEAIKCFGKALQTDPQFQLAHDNHCKACGELARERADKCIELKIVKKKSKYYLADGKDMLKTPTGNVIEANSPVLLEAIISDILDQGKIIVENGVLIQPRCLSTYVLASSAIDFNDNWESFVDNLRSWLEEDPIFLPASAHPIIMLYQQQPKVELFFSKNNLAFKVRDQYNNQEWQDVITFLQGVVSKLTTYQKSAIANLAWTKGKQFVSTIMFVTGRFSESEWAKAIFSRRDDVCMIVGDVPMGGMFSMPDNSSEEKMQEILNALEEEAFIVKRFLDITSENR